MGVIRIKDREATIGRNPQSTVVVSDPRISRTHALIRRDGDAYVLEVLPKVTHAELIKRNGNAIRPGERQVLAAGDVLSFGRSPSYEVIFDRAKSGETMLLEFADETDRASTGMLRSLPRLVGHPAAKLPGVLTANFEIVGDVADDAAEGVVDAVVLMEGALPSVAERVGQMRDERFFLPIVVLGESSASRREDAPFPVLGDAYLFASATDGRLPIQLLTLVTSCRERERAALPFKTGEILYLDTDAGRVFGHDWVKKAPRDIRVSELEHQIVLVIATSQRDRPGTLGLSLREVQDRLESKGWARSERTVANELSVRLPQVLKNVGFHPQLYSTQGTREKTYGLSTPGSCLRDLKPSA
ncbi:MAG: FHA domain-containing protein [Acidobacteriota bacterium]